MTNVTAGRRNNMFIALRACLIKNVADRVAYPETFFVLSRRSVPGYMTEGQDEKRPGYARQRKLEHIDGLEKMY